MMKDPIYVQKISAITRYPWPGDRFGFMNTKAHVAPVIRVVGAKAQKGEKK
jgi:hypothetical protein